MNNLEILKEIEKEIKISKEKNNAKDCEKTKAIISDIENLIKQYKPENDIQKRIIQNRISEVNNLKIGHQANKTRKRKIRS
jgi:hypothetical protein